MTPVTDPKLLRMLDGPPMTAVTDPDVLARLNAEDSSFMGNVAAGAGKAVADTWRGIKQIAAGPDFKSPGLNKLNYTSDQTREGIQKDIDESRVRDAPLMDTAGGKIGNIAGNVAMAAPLAFVPGANTLVGASVAGGIQGLIQPTSGNESRTLNAAGGALLGGVGQKVGGALGNAISNRLASSTADAGVLQAQNATRDAALNAGRQAGYVVPPSTVNPSKFNQTIESVGGKIATAQAATAKNQAVTDSLARQGLGMRPDAAVTVPALESIRKSAYQAGYEPIKSLRLRLKPDQQFSQEVQALGGSYGDAMQAYPNSMRNPAIEGLVQDLNKATHNPGEAIDLIRKLRFDASKNYKAFDDPEKSALAGAQRTAANALEGLIDRRLTQSGMPDMVAQFRAARELMAKSHDVEAALQADGHISAKALAKMSENGYMTGPLKTIADFAGTFPKATQDVAGVGSEGVHNLKTYAAATIGALGGGPLGAAAPFVAGPASRSLMFSKPYQSMMATPAYKPSYSMADMALGGDKSATALRLLAPAVGLDQVRSK